MSAVVPDVIVLDLRMPEMTGSEFLQALRRSPAGRRIPVLIVSGYLEDAAPSRWPASTSSDACRSP
jgi:CheY-like chemotaxis protein